MSTRQSDGDGAEDKDERHRADRCDDRDDGGGQDGALLSSGRGACDAFDRALWACVWEKDLLCHRGVCADRGMSVRLWRLVGDVPLYMAAARIFRASVPET